MFDDEIDACRQASKSFADFSTQYWMVGHMANKLPGIWSSLPYRTRLELREFADKMERCRKGIDKISFARWIEWARESPWGALEAQIFARRWAVLISTIRSAAAEEDARALEVAKRYEGALPAAVTGEYVTLTSEQLRARNW